MQIEFMVDDTPCRYRQDLWTGSARLELGTDRKILQRALSLSTQFDWRLARSWEVPFNGHLVRVEKTRPRFFATWRRHHYRILVDGQVVADRSGR